MAQNSRTRTPQEIFRKNSFEKAAWSTDGLICGIDEVGRGCLAGPLVTAAVILPPHTTSRLLKDSKLIDESERLKAYSWIKKHCWYGLGIVHHRIIDKHNIWHATLIAMKRALMHAILQGPKVPDAILIDAMPLNLFDTSYKSIPVHHFYKGESKSSSIAAASILAKVTRDAMMRRFELTFPGYCLADHKGYSTPKHKNSLSLQPASLIHRKSFLTHIELYNQPQGDIHDQQQCLC